MSSLFLLNTSLLWPVNEIDYKLIVAVRAKTLLSQLVSGRSVLARLCPKAIQRSFFLIVSYADLALLFLILQLHRLRVIIEWFNSYLL